MILKDKNPTPIEDTVECVEALAKIVKENNLGKIKISTEEIDIVIESCHKPPMPPMMPPIPPIMSQPPVQEGRPQTVESAEKPESGNVITSPIIGTFYSSPSPEKPTYVKVGDNVSAGDVVCIIESMKLMNEINSEFSGRVAEIYVNNGDPVEFGQKLMRIE